MDWEEWMADDFRPLLRTKIAIIFEKWGWGKENVEK